MRYLYDFVLFICSDKNYEYLEGSLSTLAAIYALFDIIVELHTGSVVCVIKRVLVFYICKTNYKKLLNLQGLKICTATFVMYDVLIYKTVLEKNIFKHLKC
jgi:hypothetical protein